MAYDPTKHHRRSIRLRGFDYTTAGAYFVTICTHGRRCLFGHVVNGELALNDAGRMVETLWRMLPERYASVALDTLIVMPNHLHGIVCIIEPSTTSRTQAQSPPNASSLSTIIGSWKSLTTNGYSCGVREHGWPPFEQRLWQRDYYEHIIRHDDALARIREYILTNPRRWADDTLYNNDDKV